MERVENVERHDDEECEHRKEDPVLGEVGGPLVEVVARAHHREGLEHQETRHHHRDHERKRRERWHLQVGVIVAPVEVVAAELGANMDLLLLLGHHRRARRRSIHAELAASSPHRPNTELGAGTLENGVYNELGRYQVQTSVLN